MCFFSPLISNVVSFPDNQFFNSAIPSRFPTIQFNSDTSYAELAQIPYIYRGFNSSKTAPTSDISCKQSPQATGTFAQLLANSGVPTATPFMFDNVLEQLTSLF